MPTLKAIHIAKSHKKPTHDQNLSKSMASQTHGKIADPDKTKNSA